MFYFTKPIKVRMAKAGINSQRALAEKTGVSLGTISNLMNPNGCASVNLGTLITICDCVGGKVWQLVKEAESAK